MRTLLISAIVLMLTCMQGTAQWTFIGPSTITEYVDLAARNGVLLVNANPGSPPRLLYGSSDGGATWQSVFDIGGPRAITPLDTGFILQIGGGRSFRGDATGKVWSDIPNPGSNVVRYFYDRATRRLYATTQRGGLLISTDQGVTWTSAGVPGEDLTWVHARGNTVLTGLNLSGAWVSNDGGTTWTEVASKMNGMASAGGFVGSDGRLYVLMTTSFFPASAKLWRSSDGGATWSELTKDVQGIEGVALRMQAQIYAEGGRIMFTAGPNIWVSNDDGATWAKDNAGIPPVINTSNFTQLVFDGGYAYMLLKAYVSPAQGFGVYRRPLAELGFTGQAASVQHNNAPRTAAPAVHPNPTRGIATISLQVDRASQARVTICDMLGREIATLHDGPLETGHHDMAWNGSAATGMYVVRVEMNGGTASQTFTHVR